MTSPTSLLRRIALTLAPTLALLVSLAGCSVFWISPYDAGAVARIDDISKATLKFYQDVLAVPCESDVAPVRCDARKKNFQSMAGKAADLESMMRLHLMRESARPKNTDSITIANKLLELWNKQIRELPRGDSTQFSSDALAIRRDLLQDTLTSAFTAEEAKKLGGGK